MIGRRGPCQVTDSTSLEDDQLSVKWNSRVISVRIQDALRHLPVLVTALLATFRSHWLPLRNFPQTLQRGSMTTIGWMSATNGWRLTQAVIERPSLFQAIMHLANSQLAMCNCAGARFGYGTARAIDLTAAAQYLLVRWDSLDTEHYTHHETACCGIG